MNRNLASRLAIGACLLVAGPASVAGATAQQSQVATDLADRDHDIHWPAGFAPDKAALFAHNAMRIDAPCETIWGHILNVRRWPDWYPNSHDVRLLGGATRLGPDVRWRWKTFGLSIESRVHEFVADPRQGWRLGWYGYAPGTPPAFYHTWLLRRDGSGCNVAMEEAGIGAGAAAFRKADEGRMHRGHQLWLATLKQLSERPQTKESK